MKSQPTFTNGFLVGGLLMMIALLPLNSSVAGSYPQKVPATGLSLIMFEQEGCHYCEVWDDNIGVSYDKTAEGKFAPLRKVDIHHDADVPNTKPVIFTPTFVLYNDGKEVGRLTGYISDDFFWGLLEPMLKKQGYRNEGKISNGSEAVLN